MNGIGGWAGGRAGAAAPGRSRVVAGRRVGFVTGDSSGSADGSRLTQSRASMSVGDTRGEREATCASGSARPWTASVWRVGLSEPRDTKVKTDVSCVDMLHVMLMCVMVFCLCFVF